MPAGHLPVLLSPGTSFDDVWKGSQKLKNKVLHKPGHFSVKMEVSEASNHSNDDTDSHNCT